MFQQIAAISLLQQCQIQVVGPNLKIPCCTQQCSGVGKHIGKSQVNGDATECKQDRLHLCLSILHHQLDIKQWRAMSQVSIHQCPRTSVSWASSWQQNMQNGRLMMEVGNSAGLKKKVIELQYLQCLLVNCCSSLAFCALKSVLRSFLLC